MGYATKRLIATSALLCLGFIAQPVKAGTTHVVSMVLGDGVQQADNSGFYGELMDEILRHADAPSNFSVFPFKRALKVYFTGDADCIWALDAAFLRKFDTSDTDMIESARVLNTRQFLFGMPGTPKISGLSDVAGKTIGVLRGSNIKTLLMDSGANIVNLSSQEAKIDMMLAGRIDAIGGWIPDIYITMKQLGLDPSLIEPMFPLAVSGDAVNVSIANVLASEAYQDILDRYGIPPSMN
jgi:ABC-type amino acid transport substrate-binding protein